MHPRTRHGADEFFDRWDREGSQGVGLAVLFGIDFYA
jgi:hypothetical protein